MTLNCSFAVFVLEEISAGDAQAAKLRMQALDGIAEIEMTEEVEIIAEQLLSKVPLPSKAKIDALHIAIATIGGIDYLELYTHCQSSISSENRICYSGTRL